MCYHDPWIGWRGEEVEGEGGVRWLRTKKLTRKIIKMVKMMTSMVRAGQEMDRHPLSMLGVDPMVP